MQSAVKTIELNERQAAPPWQVLAESLSGNFSTDQYPLVMTNIANWKITIEIVDFLIENGGSFHSYVKLPEGILKNSETTSDSEV